MGRWIIHEPTAKTCEDDSGEPSTSAKYRTHLVNVEDDLRAALSDIEPRFDLLCSKMQANPSH
jgi:hypothetical protein